MTDVPGPGQHPPPFPTPPPLPAPPLLPPAPPPVPVQQNVEPPLLQLGDITVTRSWVVTPNGTRGLRGTTWIASDNSRLEQVIPTWAIVLAIVFALLCLLGLLFLLAKENRVTGYVQVTVQAPDFFHSTQVPISAPEHVAWVRQQVAQAQAYAAQAPAV